MRIVILLVLSLLSCFISLAQNYGNEWISYDQKHFSFPIVESGIHKIEYAANVYIKRYYVIHSTVINILLTLKSALVLFKKELNCQIILVL